MTNERSELTDCFFFGRVDLAHFASIFGQDQKFGFAFEYYSRCVIVIVLVHGWI